MAAAAAAAAAADEGSVKLRVEGERREDDERKGGRGEGWRSSPPEKVLMDVEERGDALQPNELLDELVIVGLQGVRQRRQQPLGDLTTQDVRPVEWELHLEGGCLFFGLVFFGGLGGGGS